MSLPPPPGQFCWFNPPPNWPPPPPGWSPPQGWAPDPSWPLPPDGWQLWVEAPPAQQPSAWGGPQGGRVTLNLPAAKILYAGGWGKKTSTTGRYVVDFVSLGAGFAGSLVRIANPASHKWAYKFSPVSVALTVKNADVRTGSRLIGGGFGVEGAALGMAGAALVNALTARNRHYGMLVFSSPHGNVILGYENLPAREIARQVLAILRPFMDWWTDDFVQTLTHPAREPAWAYLRSTVEQMSERGWLTPGQLSRIELVLKNGEKA